MLTSKKRVTAICAPTGFGKSPAVVAAAILSKQPTCVVTNSRGLQDQYMRDFGSIGMVDIRGRRNYKCDMRPDDDYSCEEGKAARCPYSGSVACPSSQAEMAASVSNLVVTNYDKWSASRKFTTGMNHFTQVIFDEGHDAPDALARSMQVQLGAREIEGLGLDFPERPDAEEFINWKLWASIARAEADKAFLAAQARITGITDPKPSWVKHFTHMRNLVRRLGILSTANPMDWVVDEIQEGYQFDPIRPAKYAEGALLMRVPRILVVSATIRPRTLRMIGVGKDDFDFTEFPSDFDPKRCPIYYIPTMRVDKRAEDLGPLWIKHDQIAARRQDRKGIVHTISYARRNEILERSRFAPNMLVNERGEAPSEMIELFRRAVPGTELVSPSIGTGYDFPGPDCEWQFVCKIPFPDGRSKIVQARQQDDPEYGPYIAMQKLVQMFGRIMRSKSDRGESFICDEHLSWFRPKYAHLAPNNFHAFLKEVNTVPPPPEKL